jgi:hypothetical protein
MGVIMQTMTDVELRDHIKLSGRASLDLFPTIDRAYGLDLDGVAKILKLSRNDHVRFESVDRVFKTITFDVPGCDHKFVNIGFNHVQMACKYCGADQ